MLALSNTSTNFSPWLATKGAFVQMLLVSALCCLGLLWMTSGSPAALASLRQNPPALFSTSVAPSMALFSTLVPLQPLEDYHPCLLLC